MDMDAEDMPGGLQVLDQTGFFRRMAQCLVLALAAVVLAGFTMPRAALAEDTPELAEVVTPPAAPMSVEEFSKTFEPRMDPNTQSSAAVVVGSSMGIAAYWWLIFVPAERRALASDKRRGEVKEYLEEIAGDESRGLERWFYDDWLKRKYIRANKVPKEAPVSTSAMASSAPTADAERAETTSADADVSPADQEVYMDKEPNFWSFDNPIVTTTALIGGAVTIGTLLHN
jgi:hypothetical protein